MTGPRPTRRRALDQLRLLGVDPPEAAEADALRAPRALARLEAFGESLLTVPDTLEPLPTATSTPPSGRAPRAAPRPLPALAPPGRAPVDATGAVRQAGFLTDVGPVLPTDPDYEPLAEREQRRRRPSDFLEGINVGLRAIPRQAARVFADVFAPEDSRAEEEALAYARTPPGHRSSPTFEQAKSFSDYLDAAQFAVGQGLASSVPSYLGALLGAAVGGPFGALLGAVGPAAVMNLGDIMGELEDEGVTDRRRRLGVGSLLAVPVTALDVVGPERFAGRLLGDVRETLAKRGAMAALGRVGREGAVQGLFEGVTEGVQEGGQYAGVRAAVGRPIEPRTLGFRAVEGAVGGFGAGGAFGVAGGIGRELRRDAPRPEEPEPDQTPPLDALADLEADLAPVPTVPGDGPGMSTPPGGPSTVVPAQRRPPPGLEEARPGPSLPIPMTPAPPLPEPPSAENVAPIPDGGEPGSALDALKSLAVNEESRYGGDEAPDALLEGGRTEAENLYRTAARLAAVLDTGIHPRTGRPLTQGQREVLVAEEDALRSRYEGTLAELRDAFGPDVAGDVQTAIEQAPVAGPAFDPEPATDEGPETSEADPASAPSVTEAENLYPDPIYRALVNGITRAMERRPEEYAFGPERIPTVAARMTAALRRGTANIESAGVRAAARALGIKNTHKAWRELVERFPEPSPAPVPAAAPAPAPSPEATPTAIAQLEGVAADFAEESGVPEPPPAAMLPTMSEEQWHRQREDAERLAGEGDVTALLPAAVARAAELYDRAQAGREALAQGLDPESHRKLTKKQRERLERAVEDDHEAYTSELEDIAVSFGDDVAERVIRQITVAGERPTVAGGARQAWFIYKHAQAKRRAAASVREAVRDLSDEDVFRAWRAAYVRGKEGGTVREEPLPGIGVESMEAFVTEREAELTADVPWAERRPVPPEQARDAMLASAAVGFGTRFNRPRVWYALWRRSGVSDEALLDHLREVWDQRNTASVELTTGQRVKAVPPSEMEHERAVARYEAEGMSHQDAVRRAYTESAGGKRKRKQRAGPETVALWLVVPGQEPEGLTWDQFAGEVRRLYGLPHPTTAGPAPEAPPPTTASPPPPVAPAAESATVEEGPAPTAEEPDGQSEGERPGRLGARVGRDDAGAAAEGVPDAAGEREARGRRGGVRAEGGRRRAERAGAAPPEGSGTELVSRAGPAHSGAPLDGEGTDSPRSAPPTGSRRGVNVRLTDEDVIGQGGPVTKMRQNLAALRLLQQLRAEGRPATREEQSILARYVGWGAFPQVFDLPVKGEFVEIQAELEELVTPEEYDRIRGSVLNAHYTSPEVIRGIWSALEQLGLGAQSGTLRALEPSMGVGHFLGFAPAGLPLRWTGVELDPITGHIARALYPESAVHVQGFEQARLPRDHFDLVVGNVPFGRYGVSDPSYPKYLTSAIHNYFIARSLDLTRPGGLVALITSRYTLDASTTRFREYFAGRADLVAAFRLPSTAFKGNAGTEVVTDLLLFQRRAPGPAPGGAAFLQTAPFKVRDADGDRLGEVALNEYYHAHPEHVLGRLALTGSLYRRNELTVEPTGPLAEGLARAIAALPAGTFQPLDRAVAPTVEGSTELPPGVKIDALVVRGAQVLVATPDGLQAAKIPTARLDRVKRLVGLRDQLRQLITLEAEDAAEETIEATRRALNATYDAFVARYGPVTKEERRIRLDKDGEEVVTVRYPNLTSFDQDPDAALVYALEQPFDPKTGTAAKADILLRRVQAPRQRATRVASPAEALPLVLDEVGEVRLDRIAALAHVTEEQVVESLRGMIFEDPATGGWEIADQYLTGNVKAKLADAREAAKREPRFRANVEALEAVQPRDLLPSEIGARLGAPWIPPEVVAQFVDEVIGGNSWPRYAKAYYSAPLAAWKVDAPHAARTTEATTTWGTARMNGVELVEAALNGQTPTITDPDGEGGRVVNAAETEAARDKLEQIVERFAEWVWMDGRRAEGLARIYNDEFNTTVPPRDDGSHLSLPGTALYVRGRPFALRPHQKNAIWRFLKRGNLGLFHVVGAGKTYTMIATAMEAKRLGLARKPMLVVPNHMVGEWARQFLELYPSAQVLVADEDALTPAKRRTFLAKAASHNWDAILVKYTQFERVPMSQASQQAFLEEQIHNLELAIREERDTRRGRGSFTKQLEAAKKRLETRYRALLDSPKDDLLTFEELGVDLVMVDEAHNFKNLYFPTKLQSVGMSSPAKRSEDLFLKTRYLNQRYNERAVVFATGTPISNSISEVFTMQRYLQPRALAELGLEQFDAWAKTFAADRTELEMNVSGTGFKPKTRFSKFVNVGELGRMFRQVADFQTIETLEEAGVSLPRPALLGGAAELVTVPAPAGLRPFLQELKRRYENMPKRAEPGVDNALAILTDGRKASLDLRLVKADAPPGGKVLAVADAIAERYRRTDAVRGTQLVFADFGIHPTGPGEFSVYAELKRLLVERGIPAREIATMAEATNDAKKDTIFAKMRSGEVRVLIGSTEKMGAGTNVQDRLVALHHLDVRYRPADLEQREGRILRQGNLLYDTGQIEGVEILRYVTEGSLDAFMWGLNRRKQAAISAFTQATLETREVEDVDENIQQEMAAAMAAASGDERVLRQANLDVEVKKLQRLRKAHLDQQFQLRGRFHNLPELIRSAQEDARGLGVDAAALEDTSGEQFRVVLRGKPVSKRADAGEALATFGREVSRETLERGEITERHLGRFAGLDLWMTGRPGIDNVVVRLALELRGEGGVATEFLPTASPQSMVQLLEGLARRLPKLAEEATARVTRLEKELADLTPKIETPFPKEQELKQAREELAALNAALQEKDKVPPARADEGSGGVTLRAVVDPITPFLQMLRDRQAQRAEVEGALAPSGIEEVEARWQAAKGIQDRTLRERVQAAFTALRQSTRHFAELDPNQSPRDALLHEILTEVEHAPYWARALALDKVRRITDGLTAGEVDTLTRVLALRDILKDIEAGLYGELDADGTLPREAPFGYTTVEQIRADLARAEGVVAGHEGLRAALARRQQMAHAFTEALVARDLLPEGALADDRYYHRQVMAYVNAQESHPTGTSSGDVRLHRKGFQRERVGGGDFNTRYQEAEFEWVAQAIAVLHMHDALKQLRAAADATQALKAEARSRNLATYYERMQSGEGDVNDPLAIYRQRIGMASGKLADLAAEGVLEVAPRFDGLVLALAGARADWQVQPAKERGAFRFEHPDWWSFLKGVLEGGGPGAKQAATIFKAIRARETEIRRVVGRDYLDPTSPDALRRLAPDGYVLWQPERGNYFFPALTLAEQVVDGVLPDTVPGSELREALVMGGRKETWIIPGELARTLDGFRSDQQRWVLERGWVSLMSGIKTWFLLSPFRAMKYNLNNLSGDLDAALLYPRMLPEIRRAASDLRRWMLSQTADAPLNRELFDLMRRRVIDNSITVAEIPDLNELPAFERLVESDPIGFMRLVSTYWRHARQLTQYRENILRLAGYRYFLREIQAGRGSRLYGASSPVRVEAARTAEERAAILTRDLIGDYGAISEGGQWLRKRVFPFFSWVEVNAKRYYWLFRNIPLEGGGTERVGRIGAAVAGRVGELGLRAAFTVAVANLFFALANLWNRLLWGEEDDELRRQGRNLHLVVGRRADGQILSVRLEGAWADFLEWLNLQDYPADVADLLRGEASVEDKFADALRAPIERVSQMWEPISKSAFELWTGRSIYPSPFSPRPIRDKGEYVARLATLDWLYKHVTGKPIPGGMDRALLRQLLVYQTDPGEAAYFEIREKAARWLRGQGKAAGGGDPTDRANALYYWKQALRFGDDAAAARWRARYRELGGTPQGMRSSVRRTAPLALIPAHRDQLAFRRTLSPREQQLLREAEGWYRRVYLRPSLAGRSPTIARGGVR